MKIAIIGGGSLGLLFSYYLNEQHEVTLYVRNISQMKRIKAEGIFLRENNSSHSRNIRVALISEWGDGDEGLSIITVKQYDLHTLFQEKYIEHKKPLLFLQNGMGHLKLIDQLHHCPILIASVEHGAIRLNENTVLHSGKGVTRVAHYRGDTKHVLDVLLSHTEERFLFQYENAYKRMLQKKLIVNAVINPLTAILRVKNGELLKNQHYRILFQDLFNEIVTVLQLDDTRPYYEYVVSICETTAENQSSMLRDRLLGRQTEVDSILGYLLEVASERQLSTPLISSLYHLIKGSEVEGGK